ncbi:MAG: hypothetical protein MZU95_04205 [Desulfomicrobium escambiense]|nr:hypothetical protein [Desulfomicrobium escambiense]
MKKIVLLLALLLCHQPSFSASNLDLEAGNIAQLMTNISQYARIQGKISNVEVSDKFNVTCLNFGDNYNTSLSAFIYKDSLIAFAMAGIDEPAEFFKDKNVIIEGIIRVNNGKPEVILDSPSQIKVLNDTK